MLVSRLAGLLPLFAVCCVAAFAGKPKPCVSTDEAAKMLNKDICISAHIYDVVEVDSGTRFLDVCPPDTPDERCGFTVVSPAMDRETVGELSRYRNQNVRIRGTVQRMNGRFGMLLSHSRQFSGGPPRFRPNPLLAHGFSAEESRAPVRDPNLSRQPRRRTFMNNKVQEAIPAQ